MILTEWWNSMKELQEQINSLTSNKEARYFYHFTSFNANEIL